MDAKENVIQPKNTKFVIHEVDTWFGRVEIEELEVPYVGIEWRMTERTITQNPGGRETIHEKYDGVKDGVIIKRSVIRDREGKILDEWFEHIRQERTW